MVAGVGLQWVKQVSRKESHRHPSVANKAEDSTRIASGTQVADRLARHS